MKLTLLCGELLSLPWKANRCCVIRGGDGGMGGGVQR